MDKDKICLMDKEDLKAIVKELYESKFEDRNVNAMAAAQILGISISTLNRWISSGLVKVSNKNDNGRVEREFNLSYLLSLDTREIKMNFRMLNK